MQFHHVGVPTTIERPGEFYVKEAGVHVTDVAEHPYRFEFLRFDPESPFPEKMQKSIHVAFTVENLDAALQGEEVLVRPFDPAPGLRVAFIVKDGAVLELMQNL